MHTDDIEAINTYIMNTSPKTNEAGKLQASWIAWYNDLNFVTKALDSTFEEASNRRNIYNAANLHPVNLSIAADLTPEQRVDHQAAIASSPDLTAAQKKAALAKSPGIPTTHAVPGNAVKHSTIKLGSRGTDVSAWQQIIGTKVDGNFGPGTASATKAWQSKNGLTPDGVVGPKTWSAAIGAPVQEAPTDTSFLLPSISPSFSPPKSAQAPLVSPTPTVHDVAVKAHPKPVPAIKPPIVTASSKTTVTARPFNKLKAAGIIGGPALAGGFFLGPIGAVAGSLIGTLVEVFAIK